jgi:hypothetical protein
MRAELSGPREEVFLGPDGVATWFEPHPVLLIVMVASTLFSPAPPPPPSHSLQLPPQLSINIVTFGLVGILSISSFRYDYS